MLYIISNVRKIKFDKYKNSDIMTPMKTISERNRAFMKASKPRRRVLIAKDVLQQIKAGQYRMTSGTYFSRHSSRFTKIDQTSLLANGETCQVCGIGSAFVSAIRLGNNFDMNQCELTTLDIKLLLVKYFSRLQLRLIESTFECWQISGFCSDEFSDFFPEFYDEFRKSELESNAAVKFHLLHEDDDKYLTPNQNVAKAIFQNIIDNKGTFVL